MVLEIGNRLVGDGHPCFIVAELGSNHDGRLSQAKELIDIAAEAGCDAVKLQIPIAEEAYPPGTKFGDIYGDEDIGDVIRRNEVPAGWIAELVSYGHRRGLQMGASTDGFVGLKIMLSADVDFVKIPSFTISHIPLLRAAVGTGKPWLLSTGAHSLGGVEEAIDALGPTPAGIFHCVSAYPAPLDQLNLATLPFLKRVVAIPVGFSDHSTDPTRAPVLATALGANLLEKHYTLSRALKGTDHFFALEPEELRAMVAAVRVIERDPESAAACREDPLNSPLLGSVRRGIIDAERAFQQRTRLGLYFARRLAPDAVLGSGDLRVLRCADTEPGLHPRYWDVLVGARLVQAADAFEPIRWSHVIARVEG